MIIPVTLTFNKEEQNTFDLSDKQMHECLAAGYPTEIVNEIIKTKLPLAQKYQSSFCCIEKADDLWLKATILYDENLTIVFEDFTCIKNLSQQSQKAEKHFQQLTQTFLENLSHEIRTPANGIVGISGLLDAEEHNEETTEYIQLIKKSANRLLEVMTDLADIARLQAGDYPLYKQKTTIQNIFEELQLKAGQQIQKHNSKSDIQWKLQATDKSISTDSEALLSALIKIIDNAIKYNQNDEITVESFVEENNILFIISDQGPGIQNIEFAMKAFRQEAKQSEDLNEGLGLGLTIASLLLKLLNAKMNMVNNQNKGTSFKINMPLE